MENQDIDLIGQTVGNMPYKIGIVDQNGNLKNQFVAKASTNRIDIPEQLLNGGGSTGGSTGGNTGGGTDPDYPNYVPGLLSDGSLTGRKLEWQGSTSVSGTTTAKFTDDLGTALNTAGDGLQFVPYMNKTLITRGVVGNSSLVPIQYDKDNKANSGNFVTTQYLPISINKKDLIKGNELVIIFDGIGESDKSATEFKSPELHIKYNSGDNSVDISQVSGYAYDNLTDTKTGERYDLGISMINSFYTQKPVAQLPASVVLFSGNANGVISLSGVDHYYSNTMNGLEITINPKTTGGYVSYNCTKLPSVIRIPKEQLVIGNKYYIPTNGMAEVASTLYDPTAMSQHYTPVAENDGSHHYQRYFRGIKNGYFEIGTDSITFNMIITLGDNVLNSWNDEDFKVEIAKVTPY